MRTEFSGADFVTIEFAPIIELSPIQISPKIRESA